MNFSSSQWDNGPLSIPHPLKKDFQAKHLSFFQGTSGGFRGLFINYAAYHHAGQYECIAQTTITQTSVATEVKVRGNVRIIAASIYREWTEIINQFITTFWELKLLGCLLESCVYFAY